jgi:hypothetical protein
LRERLKQSGLRGGLYRFVQDLPQRSGLFSWRSLRPIKSVELRRALRRAREARICPDHLRDSRVSELLNRLLNTRDRRDHLAGIETLA